MNKIIFLLVYLMVVALVLLTWTPIKSMRGAEYDSQKLRAMDEQTDAIEGVRSKIGRKGVKVFS